MTKRELKRLWSPERMPRGGQPRADTGAEEVSEGTRRLQSHVCRLRGVRRGSGDRLVRASLKWLSVMSRGTVLKLETEAPALRCGSFPEGGLWQLTWWLTSETGTFWSWGARLLVPGKGVPSVWSGLINSHGCFFFFFFWVIWYLFKCHCLSV